MAKDNEVVIIDFATRKREILGQNPVTEITEIEASSSTTHHNKTRRNSDGSFTREDIRYKDGRMLGISGGIKVSLDILLDNLPPIGDLSSMLGTLQSIKDFKIKK